MDQNLSECLPCFYRCSPKKYSWGVIVFNDVHKSLHFSKIITYADDSVIFTFSKDFDLDAIQHNLNEDINSLASWFRENELIIHLKKGKTEVMLFERAKRLSGFDGKELNLSQKMNLVSRRLHITGI